jgi:hypothetical protein
MAVGTMIILPAMNNQRLPKTRDQLMNAMDKLQKGQFLPARLGIGENEVKKLVDDNWFIRAGIQLIRISNAVIKKMKLILVDTNGVDLSR